MKNTILKYCKNNLLAGFRTSPLNKLKITIVLFLLYVVAALTIGKCAGLFKIEVLHSRLLYILPVTLFIFPSFLEETIFRGMLIPNNIKDKNSKSIIVSTLISTVLFTAWHPFNAFVINITARSLFYNPYFLLIVFFLGVVCSLTYIFSKSLWIPIMIHWLTVLVWVLFMGGRNLILQ